MIPNTDLKKTWQIIGVLYRPRFYSAMQKVTLGDTIIALEEHFKYKGIVTTITMRGVIINNVSIGCELKSNSKTKFVKWCNIISYEKSSKSN